MIRWLFQHSHDPMGVFIPPVTKLGIWTVSIYLSVCLALFRRYYLNHSGFCNQLGMVMQDSELESGVSKSSSSITNWPRNIQFCKLV